MVEIHYNNNVKTTEIAKIKKTIQAYNCCIYSSNMDLKSNSKLLRFVESIGMKTYDCNNIDSNRISTITPRKTSKVSYIPYTDKALNWHTDGYYDEKSIFSWLLHCISPASEGGENYLLDHELALREYVLRHDDINNLMSEDIFNTLENDINNGSNDLDGAIDLEDLQNNNIEELQATASFLKIKELKLKCRARNLRLKEKDVIVAVAVSYTHLTLPTSDLV